MEITNFIKPVDIEAFEFFAENIEEAKKRTISEMIKRIYADLESSWYLGKTEKKKRFEVELRKVKKLLEKETNALLVEWFDSYIMD